MLNTFYTSFCILSRVYSEKTFIKQAINSEPIEPINKNLVVKICYGVVDKDITLEYFLSILCEKRPKLAIRILLKIAIYNIYFLKKAPYAVTDVTVELAKKIGKSGVSGFINAILRKFIKTQDSIEFPKDELTFLSVKYSYPEFAVKRLIADYGKTIAEKIMGYDRVNTYVRFPSDVDGEKYLTQCNKIFEKTPFYNLFIVKNFTRNEDFDRGVYTFQSIGSVAICNIIEQGERLLDCCAAPGGKSVTLSTKFKQITACEIHPHRSKLIEDYVKRMGVTNIEVFTCDSTVFSDKFLKSYDAVLCDSPCSGFGVVYENPDVKLNRENSNLTELNSTQLKILTNCSKYVKDGGYLYYSTCSIFSSENDNIIEKFLKLSPDFQVCEITSPLNHIKTNYGIQFLPHISSGAGYFICKMKRI